MNDSSHHRPRPIPLRPDNFTPASRTPWGGRRIVQHFKADILGPGRDLNAVVGESWELSAGPEFPSFASDGRALSELLAEDPAAMLGDELGAGRSQTALLVKWLDAAEPLSLQIHPTDAQVRQPDASGKPECWYVVDCEPGATLVHGFQPGTTEARVREALEAGAGLEALLCRIPVQRGDLVVLDPGTPHAVGAGITLIEPQRVLPGRRGLTYRYWDYGRRYDGDGRPDPHGQLRPLHLEEALAVTDWDRASDPAWLSSRRRACGWPDTALPARHELLCGPEPDALLDFAPLRVERLGGSGHLELPERRVLRCLTVVEGTIVLGTGAAALRLQAGCSAALPAGLPPLELELLAAHALLSSIAPAPAAP
ncbi:MAG: class I mannose-6-phosphate isomerase [Myxococcales bacterium]|nr:class I mannose-6-phosphate isomerase [Myxococcales bacterium]